MTRPAPVLPCPAEVTSDALPALVRSVEEATSGDEARLVLDLGGVRFLGSAGLGELVKIGKRLRERGGGIALARPKPRIRRLLALVGLDGVLRVFPSVEEAQEHLAATARDPGGDAPAR